MTDNTMRLYGAIAAVCPIVGVVIGTPGDSATCKFRPDLSATSTQIAAAQSALAAFDWSDTAYQAWLTQQQRNSANSNIGTSTSGLSEPTFIALRALVEVLVDQLNVIRAALPSPLPAITYAQAKTAIQNKINSGSVDS